jgi:hypothetical protein
VDRLASFRVIYAAIFAFTALYVFSVGAAEWLLQQHFESEVARAVDVDPSRPSDPGVVPAIRERLGDAVTRSPWVRIGRVRVLAFVYGADGVLIHPAPDLATQGQGPEAATREGTRVLPASFEVSVSVPHNSLLAVCILLVYAAALLWGLFLYTRSLARQEEARLREAESARDDAAERARRIESELGILRQQVTRVDPAETPHAEEIRQLRAERRSLQDKLASLARREEELSAKAARSMELDDEIHALEELLEESLRDLEQKDGEIQSLRNRVSKAERAESEPAPARERPSDQIERRLRTLYPNLEVDDRALRDLVALRNLTMQLKAEEALKRLSDEADNAAVRRKVGGLPPGLPVFEMGFAGKGRIYYTHGTTRRFRILCVGAKNTQKQDLEYLSRIVKG